MNPKVSFLLKITNLICFLLRVKFRLKLCFLIDSFQKSDSPIFSGEIERRHGPKMGLVRAH